FCAVFPTSSTAMRPEPAENAGVVTPVRMPLGLSNQAVTIVIQLSGNPVAIEQGNAGRKLSKEEKEQIKGRLRGAQNAIRGSVESLGGTVLGQYQSAYNGVKVRIGRDKVEQLAALP